MLRGVAGSRIFFLKLACRLEGLEGKLIQSARKGKPIEHSMSQSGGHGLVGHLVTFKATSISHVCFFVSRSKGCSAPFAACDLPALTEALLQNFSRHGLVWIPSNQTSVFSAFDTYVLSCQI